MVRTMRSPIYDRPGINSRLQNSICCARFVLKCNSRSSVHSDKMNHAQGLLSSLLWRKASALLDSTLPSCYENISQLFASIIKIRIIQKISLSTSTCYRIQIFITARPQKYPFEDLMPRLSCSAYATSLRYRGALDGFFRLSGDLYLSSRVIHEKTALPHIGACLHRQLISRLNSSWLNLTMKVVIFGLALM
jgi:hypothetical protein